MSCTIYQFPDKTKDRQPRSAIVEIDRPLGSVDMRFIRDAAQIHTLARIRGRKRIGMVEQRGKSGPKSSGE